MSNVTVYTRHNSRPHVRIYIQTAPRSANNTRTAICRVALLRAPVDPHGRTRVRLPDGRAAARTIRPRTCRARDNRQPLHRQHPRAWPASSPECDGRDATLRPVISAAIAVASYLRTRGHMPVKYRGHGPSTTSAPPATLCMGPAHLSRRATRLVRWTSRRSDRRSVVPAYTRGDTCPSRGHMPR